jgi:hypothetical protein
MRTSCAGAVPQPALSLRAHPSPPEPSTVPRVYAYLSPPGSSRPTDTATRSPRPMPAAVGQAVDCSRSGAGPEGRGKGWQYLGLLGLFKEVCYAPQADG